MSLTLFLGLVVGPLIVAVWVLPGLPWALRADPFLWPVLFVALFARTRQSALLPVTAGLLRDVFTLVPLCSHAIVYAIVFRLAHRHRDAIYKHAPGTQIGVTLMAAIAVQLLVALGVWIAGNGNISAFATASVVAQMALITAVLAPVAFALLGFAFRRFGVERTRAGDYCM